MARARRGISRLSALRRVLIAIVVGLVVGAILAELVPWQAAALLGWNATAVCFLLWVWLTIGGLSPGETRDVAVREDPSAALADSIVLFAGVACLGAVAMVLIKAANSHGSEKAFLIAIGVASVAASWGALHTIFTLRYARIFYTGSAGGVQFNEKEPPDYIDFAYLALTIGLTFQVSDTDLTSKQMRRTALRHALLSYLFGAVIVALTINVVASLLSSN